MYIYIFAIVIVAAYQNVAGTPCCVSSSSKSFLAAPQLCASVPAPICVTPVPPIDVSIVKTCFNPKQALYEKYPLLYKIRSKCCNLLCKDVNSVKLCSPEPKMIPCSTSAQPAPVCAVPPPPATASLTPTSYSNQPQMMSPEVYNTLLAFKDSSGGKEAPLQSALGCDCCCS